MGIAVVVVPLFLLRTMQDQQVRSLIQGYLAAPTEPVELSSRLLANDYVALDFNLTGGRDAELSGSVNTDYLIADFDASDCNLTAVTVTLRYESSHAFADFTRRFAVNRPGANGVTRITLATYSYSTPERASSEKIWYRAKGFELPAAQRSCLTRVSRLRHPSQFPVMLNTALPPDWERLPLYLTLSRWERRPVSATPAVYLSPPDLSLDLRVSGGELLRQSDVAERASNVTLPSDGSLVVDGAGGIGGAGRDAFLARFRERSLTRGKRLVIEGNLKQGGLSVGWLRNGAWVSELTITEPGPFVAALEALADANYSFVIANNLKGSSLTNICEFTRLAWLP